MKPDVIMEYLEKMENITKKLGYIPESQMLLNAFLKDKLNSLKQDE